MKNLAWIVVLLIAIPVLAQNEDPASTAFQALEVSNVRLSLSEEEGASLIFNASPAVCEDLLIDIAVDSQSIKVNVFAPHSEAVCNTLVAYEPVIALPELETGQAYLLYLNDFTTTFFLAEIGEDSSTEPFATLWGEDNFLIGFDTVAPFLDSIEFSGGADGLLLNMSGEHPDGCETEEFTRVYQDNIQENLYHVDNFRLVPQGVMCPASLMPFEAEVSLEAENGDIVEIDDSYFLIEGNEAIPVNQYPLVVMAVEILSGVNGNIVAVTGTQDCGFEAVAHVLERDFISAVDIFAYVPSDEACGDLTTPYDEGFFVDSLPIVINGVAYDENGEIDPMASSQSDNQEAEGNAMPVDTVIETVEVAILESFPMQLQLVVSGYQPDGCDFPVEVAQRVDGNDVTLHIFRNVPPDVMCTMNLAPYEETILIDGGFTEGTVNIQVNEFTTSVDL